MRWPHARNPPVHHRSSRGSPGRGRSRRRVVARRSPLAAAARCARGRRARRDGGRGARAHGRHDRPGRRGERARPGRGGGRGGASQASGPGRGPETVTAPVAHRVLVVDDEPDITALVAYHLAKAGYRVATLPTPLPAVTPVGLVWRDVARPQQPIPQGGETPNDVFHSSGARGGRRGRRGARGPTDRPTDRTTATAGDRERRRVWPVPVPAQGQFGRGGPEPVLDPTRLHQRGRQVLGRPPDQGNG